MTEASTDTSSGEKVTDWKDGIATLLVLYRIGDCGEKIHVVNLDADKAFIEPHIGVLSRSGLLEVGEDNHWKVSEAGEAHFRSLVEKVYRIQQYNIFGGVDLKMEIPDEHDHPENAGHVLDTMYDPRFVPEGEENTREEVLDLRLAMLNWQGTKAGGSGWTDPREVVFMQKVAAGYFQSDMFWADFELGVFYKMIDDIIDQHYTWEQIGDTPEECDEMMSALFTLGMIQVKKLEGDDCGDCEVTLGAYPDDIENCPGCGKEFGSGEPEPEPEQELVYDCAMETCSGTCSRSDVECPTCGEEIDWSGVPGTSVTETHTTEHSETIVEEDSYMVGGFSGGYGYDPYNAPYIDPWDPCAVVAVAALSVCAYDSFGCGYGYDYGYYGDPYY